MAEAVGRSILAAAKKGDEEAIRRCWEDLLAAVSHQDDKDGPGASGGGIAGASLS